MEVDWARLVFSEHFEQRINNIARKKFPLDGAAAEEAVTYTLNGLSADNWQKCRAFKGNSSPETFLYSLSSSLINDYFRKLYGRARPPAWLQRKGQFWVKIWQELCLQRTPLETLLTRYCEDASREREQVTEIVRTIKCKLPWCGVSDGPTSLGGEQGDVESHLDFISHRRNSDSDEYDELICKEAVELASLMLENAEDDAQQNEASFYQPGNYSIIRALNLTQEELIVLKMRFCEALSFAEIAKRLDKPQHQPVRLIKTVLARTREQFRHAGIDLEDTDFG